MSDKPFRILLVEDNSGDARLLREALAEVGSTQFELAHVEGLGQATLRLAQGGFDAVLLDLSLPDGQGLDNLRNIRASGPGVPVVVLTGLDDESVAVRAVGEGAQDYLVKGQTDPRLLERSLRYAVERGKAQEAERLRSLELGALFKIASVLARSGSFDSKAAAVVEQLAEVSAADWVALRRARGEEYHLVAAAGPVVAGSPPFPRVLREGGLWVEATRSGRPALVNDYASHPQALQPMVELGIRSLALLPLKAKGRTVGLLSLGSRKAGHFGPALARLLEAVVDGLCVLLENTSLSEELAMKEELERRQNTFISLASHELRTPMTGIMGFTELLLRRKLPEAIQRRWLERVYHSSRRLTGIVDDLLNVSRIQSGKLIARLEPLELRPIVKEEVEAIQLANDRHRLTEAVPAGLPPVVADRDKLGQVLANLLDNAVKYSPGGGEITVSARQEPGHQRVVVRIQDQGIGMTPEDQKELFTTFHRIHRPETEGVGGTGLGLFIVKELTELMRGRVWVESELGRGSIFFLSLPAPSADGVIGSGAGGV